MKQFIEVNDMDKKIINLLIVIVFVSLFLIPSIFALGVTPGRTTLDFSSNLEKEVSFEVVNTENKNMNVAFSVEGDLAGFITLSSDVESFSSSESSKTFKYKLNLPRGLSPGLHEAKIVITDLPENMENKEVLIQATVSVVTQLHVYVPYPGKYLEAKLDIVNNEKTNLINFYVPLISRGDTNIQKVSGLISIYKDGEKVSEIKTNEFPIGAGERKELLTDWTPTIAPGQYLAEAKINYDGEEIIIKKEFNAGNESLGILSIGVNDFKLGDVARIKILVQNKLSDTIKGAFTQLEVYDSNLDKIAELKSENYEIPSLSNKEMVIYWDTENLNQGRYDSELKIDYNKNTLSKSFKVDVTKDSMLFTGVGFVVSSEGGGKLKSSSILYIVIGFLVLINFAWFIWWMRHKKKKK